MKFGEHVRQTREARSMSQKELALAVGITPQYLNDVELGRRNPPAEGVALKLGEALGIPSDVVCVLAGRLPPDMRDLSRVEAIGLACVLETFRETLRRD